jgi:hypothetical protein
MRVDRRAFLLAACSTALASRSPADERYPSHPIGLVLPYAAGGGTDAIARLFAKALEEALGGTIVVENRPGAAGNIATDAVSAARPDGYTLLIGNQGPMVVNPHLYKNMKSDPEQTLEPIILIASAALVVVVGPSLKLTTLPQLIDEAKRRPDALCVGLQCLRQSPGDAAVGAGDRHQGTPCRLPGSGAGPQRCRGRPCRLHGDDHPLGHRPHRWRYSDRARRHRPCAGCRPARRADHG